MNRTDAKAAIRDAINERPHTRAELQAITGHTESAVRNMLREIGAVCSASAGSNHAMWAKRASQFSKKRTPHSEAVTENAALLAGWGR